MTTKVPQDINARAVALWVSITNEHDLAYHQIELLHRATEVITLIDEALETLKLEGSTYHDKFDQPKPHPCVSIVQQGIKLEKELIRELYLDDDDDEEDPV